MAGGQWTADNVSGKRMKFLLPISPIQINPFTTSTPDCQATTGGYLWGAGPNTLVPSTTSHCLSLGELR